LSEEFDSDMLMSAIELMRTNPKFKKFFLNFDEYRKQHNDSRESVLKMISESEKMPSPDSISEYPPKQQKLLREYWESVERLKTYFAIGQEDERGLLEKQYDQLLFDHCEAKRKGNVDLHNLGIKRKGKDDIDVKTYAEYSKSFFKYRFEFLSRGADKTHELYTVYWYLAEDDTEITKHINSAISNFPTFPLTFTINPSKPFESTLADLDNFTQNAKFFISLLYEHSRIPENPFLIDLVRKKNGDAIDRENPSKLFKRWERCLKAYDMREYDKLTPTEISAELLDYEYTDDSNKIHRVDEFVEEAEKLIKSAVNGTFPVIS